MLVLTLLRHAKSSWDDPVERDFDRPLNGRGRRAAARIGQWLQGEGLGFDRVLASPALRVRQTIEGVEDGFGSALSPVFDGRLYLATAPALLDIVKVQPASAARLLMVAHNPGLEELVQLLTPEDDDALRKEAWLKYPTATIAELVLDADRWNAAAPGALKLVRFKRPRDLDATLGPDD